MHTEYSRIVHHLPTISKINNKQQDNAKDLDIVILLYNLIEYSDNHLKTSKRLYQFCRDEPKNPITDSK